MKLSWPSFRRVLVVTSNLMFGAQILIADGHADTVPVSGPFGYHSSDPTPVNVKLESKTDGSRSIMLHIPRSAIIFIPDFSSRDVPTLPNDFTVRGYLKIALTYPDGVPFGEAVERWRRDHNTSLGDAATLLRPSRTMAEIRLIKPGKEPTELFGFLFKNPQGFSATEVSPFEGLKATELLRRDDQTNAYDDDVIFFGEHQDFFDYIQCSRSNRNPIVFCNYYLKVSDRAAVISTFVDFRFNGGRTAAKQRMRMVVRAYCDYSSDASTLCLESQQ